MSLAHKVALNSGAQALRQVIVAVLGLASIALVSRYLPIADYGKVLTAFVIVSLFAFAGDFGITATAARMMAKEPERRLAISACAMWTWAGFSLAAGTAVLIISMVAYSGADHELTRQCVVIMLFASTILSPFVGVANAVAVVDQRVWLMAIGSTLARILSLAVIVTVIVLDLGPIGIAVGFAAGLFFEALFGLLLIRPPLPFKRPDVPAIRTLVAAAVPLGLVMVVNGLYFKLDAFLLSILSTSEDIATYAIAYRAFEMLAVLPGFVMITLLPVLAQLSADEPRFAVLVQKAFTAMCLLSGPLIAFALLGTEMMTMLGGSQYSQGGFVLSFILLSVAISCLNGVFGNALVSQARQGVLLKVSVLNLALNCVLNLIAIPIWGANGAAVALCISEITSLTCTMLVYRRIAPLPHVEMPVRFAAAVIAMAAAMSVRYLVTDTEIVRLVVAIAVGIPVYVGTLALLRAIPSFASEPVLAAVGELRRRFA